MEHQKNMNKPLIIAYYLPQYHPFKENDEWWGKGYTEWTNVGKAKKLFWGHDQPKVPADLGYYDLRVPEVREEQAKLAREAGVDAFCYWHYWFGGKGRQLMNRIIDEVAASGKPDFPFCLGWANESWKAKVWNADGQGDTVLMEQRYEGVEDYRAHYEYARELFKNKNYLRIDGRPLFLIYKPGNMPNTAEFIKLWNKWISDDSIAESVYFIGGYDEDEEYSRFLSYGFDAVTSGRGLRCDYFYRHTSPIIRRIIMFWRYHNYRPYFENLKDIMKYLWIPEFDAKETGIPYIIPQWDHTPRSGKRGSVMKSTPEWFKKQALYILSNVMKKNNKIVFLKSWNEWGEGNYMEPDLKWGKAYIKALREVVDELK